MGNGIVNMTVREPRGVCARRVIPFVGVYLVALALITYFPLISLSGVRLCWGMKL